MKSMYEVQSCWLVEIQCCLSSVNYWNEGASNRINILTFSNKREKKNGQAKYSMGLEKKEGNPSISDIYIRFISIKEILWLYAHTKNFYVYMLL